MPLHAPIVTPPPPPPAFVPPPKAPTVESPFVTWTPPGGPEQILTTGGDIVALSGIVGLDMPPEEQYETDLAGGDGGLLNGRRAGVREVMVPVKIARSATLTEFEQRRRALIRAFDPRRGDGVLKWQLPDGSARYLTCRYSRGLESPREGHQGNILIAHYQVILRMRDPYPLGDPVTLDFSPPVPQPFFPGPPFTISESSTLGERTVNIDGDVETWGQWELTGPGTTAQLRHEGTGKELILTPGLLAGQTLIIRTDPRTIASQKFTRNGVNVWAQVAGQFPSLWPLLPGENRITVTMAGTGPGSRLRLTYRPRYLTA